MTVFRLLLAAMFLGVFVFLNCAPKPAPGPSASTTPPSGPSGQVSGSTSAKSWEKELGKLIVEAKKEGRVVLYGSLGAEVGSALTDAFKKQYGINVEVFTASGGEISAKLLAERRSGIYLADVFVAGSTTPLSNLKPANVLDPLTPMLLLPELTDPEQIKKTWYGGELPWVDKEGKYLLAFLAFQSSDLAINTSVVKAQDFKSYKQLLNPEWTGKIIQHDPTIPGNGGRWFGVFGSKILGLDFMRELVKQKPLITRDQRLIVDWVANGKAAIAIAPRPDTVSEYIKAGASIQPHHMVEGNYLTSGSGNLSLVNKAPHPDAAKLFINWLLSREGGIVFSKAYGSQSARLDVPTDFLSTQAFTRYQGVEYFPSEKEEFLSQQNEHFNKAREMFASLLR